jgi:DNA-binding MurR/RpiR family transcriptional regulator
MAVGLPDAGQPDSAQGVVSCTLHLEVQALQEMLRHLDGEAVQRTVDALSAAGAVLFIGTGSALPACALGAYRLAVLGIRATHTGDPATMLAEVHLLHTEDIVFAISHHGAPQHVVFALGHARERGVRTVCLTAAAGSPAARAADVALLTLGQAGAGGPGQFASRVVSAALIEGLVAAVAWRKFGGMPSEVEDLLRAQRRLNVPGRSRARRRAPS